MSWFDALLPAFAAVCWLVLPGLALGYAVGLRGLSALGMAPTFSVVLLSLTAVVGQKVGLKWSVPLALGATVLFVAVGALVSLLLRRVAQPRPSDPARTLLVAAAGIVPAAVLAWFVVVTGMGSPNELSQTYDAIFHYSALNYILESGSASSLTMITLGNPLVQGGFYPAGWHAVTSLVVLSTGADIAVAANVMAWAMAGLIWPIGCLLLVRQIVGRNTAAMFITPVLAVAFTSMPWQILGWGVLWPNVLGLALVPAGLAAVLAATRLAVDDVIGIRRSVVLAPLVLIACGFAHPNAVFSLAVLALSPLAIFVLRYAVGTYRSGRWWRGVLALGGSFLGFMAVWYYVSHADALKAVRQQYWAPFETPSQAVGEALLNGTNGRVALWVLSALVIAGLFITWRLVARRWLIGAAFTTTFLYVLTAALNRPGTQMFTGYWYNDSFRLAAMLPITGVPLAVLAVLVVGDKIASLVPARFPALLRTPTAMTLLIALLLVPLTKVFYFGTSVDALNKTYTQAAANQGELVDGVEEKFLPHLRALPRDAVVANNPWDGSAMMLASAGREALFKHVDIPWSAEQKFLAVHLRDAAVDDEVCVAAQRVGVRYMLIAHLTFWNWEPRTRNYPGISEPSVNHGAFSLVAAEGAVRLYRLDKCGTVAGSTS